MHQRVDSVIYSVNASQRYRGGSRRQRFAILCRVGKFAANQIWLPAQVAAALLICGPGTHLATFCGTSEDVQQGNGRSQALLKRLKTSGLMHAATVPRRLNSSDASRDGQNKDSAEIPWNCRANVGEP
jgi:hypothetical protein